MPGQKSNLRTKIRSIKQWLSSAESNFEQEQELKGQINLMLAQAEMKTLQLGNVKWYKGYYRPIILLGFCLILIFGISYRHFTNQQKPDKIVQNNFPTAIGNYSLDVEKIKTKPQIQFTTENIPAPQRAEEITAGEGQRTSGLTDVQKRSLIRQAQKSLHGEAK